MEIRRLSSLAYASLALPARAVTPPLTGRSGGASRRRAAPLAGALAMVVAVAFARQLTIGVRDSLDDAVALLYVIPVALVAMELGLRAGVLAALAAIAACMLSTGARGVDVEPMAQLVRSTAFLAAAGIVGGLSDRMRSHGRRERELLRAEVEDAHRRLGAQLRNAGHLLAHHERERRGVAAQLHEEVAQTVAAALLAIGMLERAADEPSSRRQLEEVRTHMRGCIGELRRIAASLRPDVLDQLGLAAALQRVAEREADNSARTVQLNIAGLPDKLPREIETTAFRLLEEALGVLSDVGMVQARIAQRDGSLELSLDVGLRDGDHPDAHAQLDAALATARARAELAGGSLGPLSADAGRVQVVARLPLRA